ncbi:PH domain-containing protein [Sulfitobacter sp. JBTF-M27]|uniref:PH domain-containing protein n=1 Tax=Sulfitobacter sediminilitoris TaxID=2698830 RepID=A0A6P0CF99_9RHOB|nr:PH domain-containing protein [Sulfitobacter sediminilitoris]NEK24060.1 PH domain-containing protein [Sulfitobacter sediminilitoris]
MSSYVESSLIKDEQVVYKAYISSWSLSHLLVAGLVLLPFYGIGLLFWASAAIKYFSTELAITNRRIIAKFGFIRRSTIEINLQKVESVQVDQSILGRLLNFGSIVVSGAGSPQTPVLGISNPLKFRQIFMETQENK